MIPSFNEPFAKLNSYFISFLERYKLNNKNLVVSCSGGGDSICLAYLMCKHHSGNLSIVHICHRLRGNESVEDLNFVVNIVNHFKLKFSRPIELSLIDGELENPSIPGIETAARKIRRVLLATHAVRQNAFGVLMGHNLDDQIETFFMRLTRGAGITGLSGIQPSAHLPFKVLLFRPLLPFSRSYIREFLKHEGINWRNDSTNQIPICLRNQIRLQLIPSLGTILGESIGLKISKHMGDLRRRFKHKNLGISKKLLTVEAPRSGAKIILRKNLIMQMNVNLLAEILYYIWKREGWPLNGLTNKMLISTCKQLVIGASIPNLPGKILVTHDDFIISIGPENISI